MHPKIASRRATETGEPLGACVTAPRLTVPVPVPIPVPVPAPVAVRVRVPLPVLYSKVFLFLVHLHFTRSSVSVYAIAVPVCRRVVFSAFALSSRRLQRVQLINYNDS